MLELYINKRKPYNLSYFVHKRWISVKLQLENDFLQFLVKTVILEVNGEPLTLKWLTDNLKVNLIGFGR